MAEQTARERHLEFVLIESGDVYLGGFALADRAAFSHSKCSSLMVSHCAAVRDTW